MRMISLPVAISLALLCLPASAQQAPVSTGESIGHPPPVPDQPPATAPNTTTTPSYAPGTTTGLATGGVADSPSTATHKPVPCSPAARETDGSTTCIGIFPNDRIGRRSDR